MKFHLIELPGQPNGYVNLSDSSDWEAWIRKCLPAGLAQIVHNRLVSNLKHILVALEMKAALIVPHAKRGNGKSLLFEPYFQMLNFEFCVGTFFDMRRIGLGTLAGRKRAGRLGWQHALSGGMTDSANMPP